MSLFSIPLAAMALAAPSLPPATAGKAPSDYPAWAVRTGQSAFVYYEMFVDPDGEILRCDILTSAGSERLAKEICAMRRRIKLVPAVDSDGNPSFGKIREETKLFLPGTPLGEEVAKLKARAEFELAVESLPPENDGRLEVDLAMHIATDGLVTACTGKEGAQAAYAKAACAALESQPFALETTADGAPVSYVREVSVEFVAEQSAA